MIALIVTRLILISALALPFAGCTGVSAPEAAAVAGATSGQVLDRLYFGRKIPRGGEISEEEWKRFLADVVTPRFPQGFTILRAEGQWREASGVIASEPSMILEIAHPDDAANERAIREIADEYKRRFEQEAVLCVRQPAVVTF